MVIFPVSVKPPVPDEVTVAAAVKTNGIEELVADDELLNNAPDDETPVPAKSISFHVESVCAFKSNAPPEFT